MVHANPWGQLVMVALLYGLAIGLAEVYKRSGNKAGVANICVWIVGLIGAGVLGDANANIGNRHRIEEVLAFFALTAASAVCSYFMGRRYQSAAFFWAMVIFALNAIGSLAFALHLLGG